MAAINPIVRLFGGETRAKVLAVLANPDEPKTAYAVSRILEVEPPAIYRELERLATTGILGIKLDPSGRRRYFVADEDLKRLLLKRIRIASADDWFSPVRTLAIKEAIDRARKLQVELPRGLRPNPSAVRNPQEFLRPPEKDRALRRVFGPRGRPRGHR